MVLALLRKYGLLGMAAACAVVCLACVGAAEAEPRPDEARESPPSLEKKAANQEHVQAEPFELNDQFNKTWAVKFPRKKVMVLTFANRRSARQGEKWGSALWDRYRGRIASEGIGVGKSIPKWERGIIRFLIRQVTDVPILLDWDGRVGRLYGFEKEAPNLVVIDRRGCVSFKFVGKPTEENRKTVFEVLDALVKKKSEISH